MYGVCYCGICLCVQLVRLPKTVTVNDILRKYSEHVKLAEPEKTK